MLKFFFGPHSCALASHIALEESGLDYEAVRLDLVAGDQKKPEYLKINPKARVPALLTERGPVDRESGPSSPTSRRRRRKVKLAPLDDAYAFGKIQAFNAYLCATAHVAHAHGRRGYRWASEQSSYDDMKRKVPEAMAACFDLIENEMLEGPWVAGADFTIADPISSPWPRG